MIEPKNLLPAIFHYQPIPLALILPFGVLKRLLNTEDTLDLFLLKKQKWATSPNG